MERFSNSHRKSKHKQDLKSDKSSRRWQRIERIPVDTVEAIAQI